MFAASHRCGRTRNDVIERPETRPFATVRRTGYVFDGSPGRRHRWRPV